MILKRRYLGLLMIAIILFCSACNINNSLQTDIRTMTSALDNCINLFESAINVLKPYETLCVYGKADAMVEEDRYTIKYDNLWYTSEEQIREDEIALLHDVINPLFLQYDLHSVLGFYQYDGTVRFVFEAGIGEWAFLEYSENDLFPKGVMTVLESAHVCEGWYAVVHSD